MMRGKALRKKNVDRFELILSAVVVSSVVPLSAGQNLKASQQSNLQKLTAIVLKYVIDPVLRGQFLKSPDVGKHLGQFRSVWMGPNHRGSFSRSRNSTPSARASRSMLSIEMFRSPRSTDPK